MDFCLSELYFMIKRHPRKRLFQLTSFLYIGLDWTYGHDEPCSKDEEIVAFAVVNR